MYVKCAIHAWVSERKMANEHKEGKGWEGKGGEEGKKRERTHLGLPEAKSAL